MPKMTRRELVAVSRLAKRCGNVSGRMLLTFDDWNDEDPYKALRIGAYLKNKNIGAMFFVINEKAQNYSDIVNGLREQGHYVGSHTYSHVRLTDLSDDEIREEIAKGVECNALRPPYGAWDERVYKIAMSMGKRLYLWTISSGDWMSESDGLYSVKSIRSAVRNASAKTKFNGVVIGHLYSNFPAAIPGIIQDMTAQGYLFCVNPGPVGQDFPTRILT